MYLGDDTYPGESRGDLCRVIGDLGERGEQGDFGGNPGDVGFPAKYADGDRSLDTGIFNGLGVDVDLCLLFKLTILFSLYGINGLSF